MPSAISGRLGRVLADAGVAIGGDPPRPWDIQVHDERLYRRVLLQGPVGLGDAYVEGWWDCAALDQLFYRLLIADMPSRLHFAPTTVFNFLGERLFNAQNRRLAGKHARSHYDLDTDLFEAMLDRRLIYTCGLWDNARDIDEAQEQKLDLTCRKLGLEKGMTLLDIGCGWGGLARFAAERYGCSVTGVTVSGVQAEYAKNHCRGLPVKIVIQDYRDINGRFDRVSCVGMFEHVGPKNHCTFMRTVKRALAPDGLFFLHFFATQRSWPNTRDAEVLWIKRHIFPGIVVPSLKQVGKAVESRFVVEDLQNIGADYEPTLLAWFENFDREWPRLREKYGERFYRMWKYYLLSCAGAFKARKYQVWQFVLSPSGVPGGYRRPAITGSVAPEIVIRPNGLITAPDRGGSSSTSSPTMSR